MITRFTPSRKPPAPFSTNSFDFSSIPFFNASSSAVAHAVNAHDPNLVVDFVNDRVVAHANAPVVLASGQLAATGRAWVGRECLNRCDDAIENLG